MLELTVGVVPVSEVLLAQRPAACGLSVKQARERETEGERDEEKETDGGGGKRTAVHSHDLSRHVEEDLSDQPDS